MSEQHGRKLLGSLSSRRSLEWLLENRVRATPLPQDALIAKRTSGTTYHCAKINHPKSKLSGPSRWNKRSNELPESAVGPRARINRLDSKVASDQADHVGIHQRQTPAVGDHQYRVCYIFPNSRQPQHRGPRSGHRTSVPVDNFPRE